MILDFLGMDLSRCVERILVSRNIECVQCGRGDPGDGRQKSMGDL